MLNRTFLTGLTLGVGLSASLVAVGSHAAGISGKKNLICANSHVVACTDGVCMQGAPKTFDLMTFLFVDFAKKQVHGVDDKGEEASSPVKNAEVTDKVIILQGFEDNRGWTMGLDRKTGGVTLSLTGADVSFILTGNCIER